MKQPPANSRNARISALEKTSSRDGQPEFLPMTRKEMELLGWKQLDVLLITGDAHVDHPAFAPALLGRWLVEHGFRTGIISQPSWENPDSLLPMGRPLLFAGITAGAVDSMLAHYTAFRKKRGDDAFTPGGRSGSRPNRATIVYANLARRAFPGLPLVLGGIEASLRRITHYDFWSDSLRRPLLADAKADLLVYGMGERPLLELANLARDGMEDFMSKARRVRGVVSIGRRSDVPEGERVVVLPGMEDIKADPKLLVETATAMEKQVHHGNSWAVEPLDAKPDGRILIVTPPAPPLSAEELDKLYALPYSRKAHPSYRDPIPAEEMLRTSITTHRGCGGGCSFCSLALHQGRRIVSRSRESVLREAEKLVAIIPRGRRSKAGIAISDVGGPSANMWGGVCGADPGKCVRASCLTPRPCPAFLVNQRECVFLLRDVAALRGISSVRVASGVRFDMAMHDEEALKAYTSEFTGGQLKVAPEHICSDILTLMRKPDQRIFEQFLDAFTEYSRQAHKEQYIVPYLMSAFPGCTDAHMRKLKEWLRARNWSPRQVQCFIPTPGTVATALFYSQTDMQGRPLFVARSDAARLRQHSMLLRQPEENPHGQHGKPTYPPRRKTVFPGKNDRRS